METFVDRLVRTVFVRRSHLCVGLDPDEKFLTDQFLLRVAEHHSSRRIPREDNPVEVLGRESAAKFMACQSVVMATGREAAAYKANAAFFEKRPTDWAVLSELPQTLQSLSPGVLTILDGKRGDIGNTSRQYSQSAYDEMGFDAVTINPLMGSDSIEPFLQRGGKGAFLLCLTSNPGADDFLVSEGLYKKIAQKAAVWGRGGALGLVVGATRAELAAEVRAIAPELPLLIPGVGAQGGDLSAILEAIDARRNPRFLINASRSIMFPSEDDIATHNGDYGTAIAAAASKLRQTIQSALD
jgi:orotidine-5'-phosphate decarboxylase